MARQRYIAGLDLGTQNIKALVINKKEGEPAEIVFQTQRESSGVRRGVVIGPEEVSEAIKEIFSRVKEETQRDIDSVYVNVSGSHLFTNPSHGLISVSRADRKVSQEDIQRVLQETQALSLSSNRKIFDVVTKEFVVDGERGIKEPLGLEGVRLEAEALVLGGFVPYLDNLTQAILSSGLQILDMIPSPLASSRACLTKKQKEQGVALIDMGAGTTSLAVFEEGDLAHLTVFPMGSANITSDIAIGLKTDFEIAEKIKIEYGVCLAPRSQKKEKIEVGEEDPLVFTHKQLAHIVETRVLEIFNEINKELKKISKERALPAGIVLTGGGAKLPGIAELAKRIFKLSVKIGKPLEIEALSDTAMSCVGGLALTGTDSREFSSEVFLSGSGIIGKIKKLFRIFIP